MTSDKQTQPTLLHNNASSAAFVFYLKFFFGIWFLRYLFDPMQDLSLLPVGYSAPVGWLNSWPGFAYEFAHSYAGLLALRIGILVCCIGVWFGKSRFYSGLIGCGCITTANALARGYGHMNHAEIGLILITWILAIFMTRFSREELQRPTHERNSASSASLVCAAIVLSLVYSLVGIARLVNGGLEFFVGDTMTNYMFKATYMNSVVDLNLNTWILSSSMLVFLVKAGTLAVTAMEVVAPICLVSKKMRYAMLLIMPGFHLGAILLFKVIFVEQLMCLILFVSVTPLLAKHWSIRESFSFGTLKKAVGASH